MWYGAITAIPRRAGQPDGHTSPVLTACAEFFQSTRVLDPIEGQPWLAVAELARDLRLLDAESSWGARVGCGRLLGSGPKTRTRRWSRVIHARYPHLDGIVWASSVWPPGDAIMLYECARDGLPMHPSFSRPLSDPALHRHLAALVEELGWFLRPL